LDEVKKIHGYAKASPFRREISEISQDPKERSEEEAETDLEIEAFSLVCWNCRKDGCGAPNTYKSSCAKCAKNSKAGTSRSPFRQTPSSALRNNGGVRRAALKVDNPISLDALVSNNSSLLHHKIHKLGRKQAVHKINYLHDLQKRKSRSARRMKTFWQTVKRCELGLE